VKLLKRRDAGRIERAFTAVLEGAARPVGGDADHLIRTVDDLRRYDDELPEIPPRTRKPRNHRRPRAS
jgi:hypothetical protein